MCTVSQTAMILCCALLKSFVHIEWFKINFSSQSKLKFSISSAIIDLQQTNYVELFESLQSSYIHLICRDFNSMLKFTAKINRQRINTILFFLWTTQKKSDSLFFIQNTLLNSFILFGNVVFLFCLHFNRYKSIERNALYWKKRHTHTEAHCFSSTCTCIILWYFCVLNHYTKQIELAYSWIRQTDCLNDEKFKYFRIKHDQVT